MFSGTGFVAAVLAAAGLVATRTAVAVTITVTGAGAVSGGVGAGDALGIQECGACSDVIGGSAETQANLPRVGGHPG